MPLPSQINDLRFPVVLWRKGYSYVASTALELCTHPRNLLSDTQERAARGELMLLDSAGRVYSVKAYQPVSPFGGPMRFAHLLLRSAYAAPVLGEPTAPPLPQFKSVLANAVRLRFRDQLVKGMASLSTAAEAVALAAKLDRSSSP